ncbi:hypothetical protein [Pedobacter glucosidilyticus]|uniref:hypothetical protein n=1 Tax=Pedobacter glucosidilyticus TaxID=1122941 RepID=UPI0026F1478C|nr:hypothetical protein [Pedobacter glucosidilyticus]
MNSIISLVKIGNQAVRKHREQKLNSGKPFMINSPELPDKQSYLEYPNHSIKLVSLSSDGKTLKVIKELSLHEAETLREKLGLSI